MCCSSAPDYRRRGRRVLTNTAFVASMMVLLYMVPAKGQELYITTPAILPNATPGALFSVLLRATGGAPPYAWRYPLGENRPFFLDLTSDGSLSGSASATDSGTTFTFHIEVIDAADQVASTEFTLTVAGPDPLAIVSASALADGRVGNSYSETLKAAGGSAPYKWSITNGILPSGLMLNASAGLISGLPSAAGAFQFTAQVMDSAGAAVSSAFAVKIGAGERTPAISSTSPLVDGAVGATYSATLAGTGGAPPYRWSVLNGALPPGLALDKNSGVISGTPGGLGIFNFTIRLADSTGAGVTKAFRLNVGPGGLTSAVIAGGPKPSADAPMAIAVDPSLRRLYAVHRSFYSDVSINDGFLSTDRVSVVDLDTRNVVAAIPIGHSLSGDGQGIALDPARKRLYVTNTDDGTVSVIDTSSNGVSSTISAAGGPAGIAVDPSSGNVYVALSSTYSVLVMSASGQTLGTVALAGHPYAVALDPLTHLVYVTVNEQPWKVVAINGATRQTDFSYNFLFSLKSIAVEPGRRVYVSDHNSGNVSVLDTTGSALKEVAEFKAGGYPDTIAVNSGTHEIYVVDAANDRVTVFDVMGTAVARIAVLRHPAGIVLDQAASRAYVADNMSDSISVIDVAGRAVAATIPLGTLDPGIAYDNSTKRMYVANFVADAVSVVDLATGRAIASWLCGAGPWAIAVDSNLGQIYTLNSSDGTVAVLSTDDGSVKARIPIGSLAGGVLAVDSNTHRVYASSGTILNNNLAVIDGLSNQVLATVEVGSKPVGVAIDSAANHVLVANQQSGTITVIDAGSNRVIRTWSPQFTNVWGLAVDSQIRRVYVTIPPSVTGNFTGLEILDADTGSFIGKVQGASTSDLVMVKPANHRVFFTDSSAGAVTVVDGKSGAVISTQATGSGALSLTLDPDSGTVYVANYLDGTISAITDAGPLNRPSISSGGVTSAASYAAGNIAPGEIITIFGTGMGPSDLVTLALDSSGKVSTKLAGTRVLFDGVPAPVIYTSATQIAAIAPYEIDGHSSTLMQVEYQDVASGGMPVSVTGSAPGIFASGNGKGQAAALNQDYSVNSSSNPSAAGSIVMIFATGEGQTSPAGVDGLIANHTLPLPLLPVKAKIGGRDAQVLYAGAAGGVVAGVMQLNLVVPPDVTPGDAVPVSISVGDAGSQPGVTIAVH